MRLPLMIIIGAAVLTLAGCFEGPLVLLARPDLKAHRARREITEELENETA